MATKKKFDPYNQLSDSGFYGSVDHPEAGSGSKAGKASDRIKRSDYYSPGYIALPGPNKKGATTYQRIDLALEQAKQRNNEKSAIDSFFTKAYGEKGYSQKKQEWEAEKQANFKKIEDHNKQIEKENQALKVPKPYPKNHPLYIPPDYKYISDSEYEKSKKGSTVTDQILNGKASSGTVTEGILKNKEAERAATLASNNKKVLPPPPVNNKITPPTIQSPKVGMMPPIKKSSDKTIAVGKAGLVKTNPREFSNADSFVLGAIDSAILGALNSKLSDDTIKDKKAGFTAGQIAGYIAPGSAATKVVGKPVAKAISKNVTSKLIPKIAEGLASGAVVDAGTGIVKGESPKDIVKRVGRGALIGGTLEGVGYGIAKGISNVGKKVDIVPPVIVPKQMKIAKGETAATKPVINPLLPDIKPKQKTVTPPLIETDKNPMKFPKTIAKADITAPELKTKIEEANLDYKPITNEATLTKAKRLIYNDYDKAVKTAKEESTAEANAVAQLLINKAQQDGRFEDAIDLIENVSRRSTQQGQAIQALRMWGRLTPEGMLKYSQKVIDKANKDNPILNLKLKPEIARKITGKMKAIQSMPEGREKTIAVAQVLDEVAAQVPATTRQKLSGVMTISQLLNPKTAIRNVIGNTGFNMSENISDVVGTAIDKAISPITGQRTKFLPSIPTQAKGFKNGFKLGLEDALLGIDTSGIKSQFDIPQNKVFRNGLLGKFEKGLNIELKATDRAFYQAAYDQSMRNQLIAAKATKPTEEMREIAHMDGLYKTFQDDNAFSKGFSKIKQALNNDKEFGIADFIIRYPKTPGSILARGLEYSPVGFYKTAIELGKAVTKKGFNQKKFVEATSRAITGSAGLVGTGALLSKLGIITAKPDKDIDASEMQKEVGLGEYKVNASALKRFILSGFEPEEAKLQKGDTLVSYDWFTPSAIGLAMGADIDKNKGGATGVIGSVINSLTSGVNTLYDQPVLSGVKKMFQTNQSLTDGLQDIAKGVPASFMPTLLNQVKQLIDNTSRNTYDPNWTKETVNRAKAKVPVLSKTLEPRVGVFGNDKEVYQNGSNNPLNVFLNPAFVSKYNPKKEASLPLDAYMQTGEKGQFPRVVGKYITYGNQRVDLTTKEQTELQRFIGIKTQQEYSKLANDPRFTILPYDKQVAYMEKVVKEIYDAGKKSIVLKPRGIPFK